MTDRETLLTVAAVALGALVLARAARPKPNLFIIGGALRSDYPDVFTRRYASGRGMGFHTVRS